MPTDTDQTTYCNARINGTDVPKIDPGPHGGDGYCSRPAGWGTEAESGRCKLHNGRKSSHGLHSTLRKDLRDYVEQAMEQDAPGDLKGELAVLRGLLFRWLNGTEDLDKDAVDAAHKLLKEIRRTSDTIHKQLTRERLTKDEEEQLLNACASIIRAYVPEHDRDEALDQLQGTLQGGGVPALESGG